MIELSAEWWEEQARAYARSNRIHEDEIEQLKAELDLYKHDRPIIEGYAMEAQRERDEARKVARGLWRALKVMNTEANTKAGYLWVHGFSDPWPNSRTALGKLAELGPVPDWLINDG